MTVGKVLCASFEGQHIKPLTTFVVKYVNFKIEIMMNKFILLCALIFISSYMVSQTVVRQIRPSDTDSLITTFNTDSNYVYLNVSIAAKNILVVHLPGSFGEPKRATLFGTLAADLGFHSIGLMYPNIPTVGSFCTNSSDPDCFENVRREIVEGVDYSSSLTINLNESILNRTKKLLVFLSTNYPSENWGQYLDVNNNLDFSKIIFSGHSQGGGHAAIIAKYYPIKRAICFSSPKDWRNIPDAPPLWLSSGNWQTQSSEIYCFNHVLDEHINHQLEIWDSLGLNSFGIPINVDSFSTPYNNTRQLTTSYNVPTGNDHACTIQDNKTPKVSNVPAFIPVWTYMLTNNLTIGLTSNLFEQNVQLLLTPNPTNNLVSFELSLKDEEYMIKLYDQTGKLLLQKKSVIGNNQLDLTNFNSGLYFVQLHSDKNIIKGKVIKQ
jgi:hypothetical protein